MAQFQFPTLDPSVNTGTQLADYLNQWRDAIHTSHSGAARPPYAQRGTIWAGTGASGATILYFFDGAADREVGRVELNAWRPANALSTLGGTLNGELTVARRHTVTPLNTAGQVGGQIVLQSGGGAGSDIIMEKLSDNFHLYSGAVAHFYMNTVTGVVTAPKFLVSSAQGTESNGLARKDYVDTQINTRLPTTGGNLNGETLSLNGNMPAIGINASGARNYYIQVVNLTGDVGRFRLVDASAGREILSVSPGSGNVGIGTSTPTARLTVNSPANVSGIDIYRADNIPLIQFFGGRQWQIFSLGASLVVHNMNMGHAPFTVTDHGALVRNNLSIVSSIFDESGFLGISSTTHGHSIQTAAAAGGHALVIQSRDGGMASFWGFNISSTRFAFLLGNNNQYHFGGNNDGNVYIAGPAGVAWAVGITASDGRLKDVHGETQLDAWNLIKAVPVKDYHYKDSELKKMAPGNRTGFVAQDVLKHIPQAVRKIRVPDAARAHRYNPPAIDGTPAPSPESLSHMTLRQRRNLAKAAPVSTKQAPPLEIDPNIPDIETLQLHKEELVPVLWRALQVAQERIEAMEADINDLRLQLKKRR